MGIFTGIRKQMDFKALLGTQLPIIQAPMAGVQDSALAIAVSEVGGLGSLPCGMLSTAKIVEEIQQIARQTNKPYNLNFFCHQSLAFDEARQQLWRSRLKPYFSELEIAPSGGGASRVPFSHEIADAIEPFVPPFISFHFGLPEKSLLARVKGWGTRVVSSATTVDEALWLEAQGADAIIAQGLEAGGHRGMFLSKDISTQMGLFALLPQIVSKVSVPVIAAGGICDSRSVKAAMELGAAAVQVGTAYMLCDEAKTSALHRQAIQSGRAAHTALTNLFSGKPARGIVNRAMSELGYMSDDAPEFPFASIEMGQLRAAAEPRGRDDFSPLWCGQNAAGCRQIAAAALTLELAGDFLDVN